MKKPRSDRTNWGSLLVHDSALSSTEQWGSSTPDGHAPFLPGERGHTHSSHIPGLTEEPGCVLSYQQKHEIPAPAGRESPRRASSGFSSARVRQPLQKDIVVRYAEMNADFPPQTEPPADDPTGESSEGPGYRGHASHS